MELVCSKLIVLEVSRDMHWFWMELTICETMLNNPLSSFLFNLFKFNSWHPIKGSFIIHCELFIGLIKCRFQDLLWYNMRKSSSKHQTQWKTYSMMVSSTFLPIESEPVWWVKLESNPNKSTDTELWIHFLLWEVGRQYLDNLPLIVWSIKKYQYCF